MIYEFKVKVVWPLPLLLDLFFAPLLKTLFFTIVEDELF